jgi:hypothetical protein
MVLASDNLTYQPPPYSSITRDYDRNRSITPRLVIGRPVLTAMQPPVIIRLATKGSKTVAKDQVTCTVEIAPQIRVKTQIS